MHFKVSGRLKEKGWKEIYQVKKEHKKAGMTILTPLKINFKGRPMSRD